MEHGYMYNSFLFVVDSAFFQTLQQKVTFIAMQCMLMACQCNKFEPEIWWAGSTLYIEAMLQIDFNVQISSPKELASTTRTFSLCLWI